MTLRLGILASHPIQYQAPLFRELARHVDLTVYFAHRQTAAGQAAAGFNVAFEWDVDLLSGYHHRFLRNRAKYPGADCYAGCDTPEIADEIRPDRFDAFLVTGWYLKSYWQAIRACRRHGVPIMVRGDSHLGTPRGWLKHALKEVVYPQILRQFDACLYVGRKNLEYLQHYGVSADRLFFSPHCIDNEAFASRALEVDRERIRRRLGVGRDQKVVLFVGKMLENKRPLDILHALRILRLNGTDVFGVLVGDGPLRNLLQVKSNEFDVPTRFIGFQNQTQLPESYVCADLIVLPSSSETWGLVVNESLACGTPVVVSDAVGCAPDLVYEGKTGAVFPVGNTLALAEALKRVLEAPPEKRAIKAIADLYSVNAAAKGVCDAAKWLTHPDRRVTP